MEENSQQTNEIMPEVRNTEDGKSPSFASASVQQDPAPSLTGNDSSGSSDPQDNGRRHGFSVTVKNADALPDNPSSFKLVRPVCAGFDIHKKLIVATVAITDSANNKVYFYQAHFDTMNSSLDDLVAWLKEYNCTDVLMESTGKYFIPIYNKLEASGINATVTHPKYVKAIKGKKNDKRDSQWIADLFRFDMVKSSFIPGYPIRMMREVARYILKLKHMRTSEKQRFQNSMTMSSIRLDCLLSDPFGKTGQNIMDYLLRLNETGEIYDPETIMDMIDKRVHASGEEILNSIDGYNITYDQYAKMAICRQHISRLNYFIDDLLDTLDSLAAPFEESIQLLCTIPGVKRESAVRILAEIGNDMSQFPTQENLVSWAGFAPELNESARKKKKDHCSKGNSYLKPLMIQCVLAAIDCKEDPYFKIKYEPIAHRRNAKRARVAMARRMLICIYNMLKKREPFMPSDYEKVIKREKDKRAVLNFDSTIDYLIQRGVSRETIDALRAEQTRIEKAAAGTPSVSSDETEESDKKAEPKTETKNTVSGTSDEGDSGVQKEGMADEYRPLPEQPDAGSSRKPKKKRSKKSECEARPSDSKIEEQNAEKTSENEAPPKKKRGRPKKLPSLEIKV